MPDCGSAACCRLLHLSGHAPLGPPSLAYCALCSTRRCGFGPHRPPAAIQGCRTRSRAAAGARLGVPFSLSSSLHCQRPKVSNKRDWTGGVLLHDSWFAGPCVKRDRPPAWLHRSSNPSPCPWYTGTRRLARVPTGRGWSQQPTATRTNHDARPGETAEPPKLKQPTLATLLSGRGPLFSHAPCSRWRLRFGNWRHFPPWFDLSQAKIDD